MNEPDSDNPFILHAGEYDHWYDIHQDLYIRQQGFIIPFLADTKGAILEVGCGSGRFSVPLGITYGVEPSRPLARIASHRGIMVIQGRGEYLPFRSGTIQQVLVVTVLGFVTDPIRFLKEMNRVLTASGALILVEIDDTNPAGIRYRKYKKGTRFHKDAHIYSEKEYSGFLEQSHFQIQSQSRNADLILFSCRKRSE